MNPPRHKHFNSALADGVRRQGFRKWYERELLSGHAYMVLAILSVIGLIGSLEAFGAAAMSRKLVGVTLAAVCAGIGLWALRRYLFLLLRAENIANQAKCAGCGEYGRFDPLSADAERDETRVQCRKCGHCWVISGQD